MVKELLRGLTRMLGDLKQMNESLLEVGKGLAVELKHVCKELKRYNDRTDNE